MHLIAQASGPTADARKFVVDYQLPNGGEFNTYTEEAHSAYVTEGGAVIFTDMNNVVINIVSPNGYTQVTPQ